jgi:hypothetical protein
MEASDRDGERSERYQSREQQPQRPPACALTDRRPWCCGLEHNGLRRGDEPCSEDAVLAVLYEVEGLADGCVPRLAADAHPQPIGRRNVSRTAEALEQSAVHRDDRDNAADRA